GAEITPPETLLALAAATAQDIFPELSPRGLVATAQQFLALRRALLWREVSWDSLSLLSNDDAPAMGQRQLDRLQRFAALWQQRGGEAFNDADRLAIAGLNAAQLSGAVLAVGILNAAPPVQRLLQRIAALPEGCVLVLDVGRGQPVNPLVDGLVKDAGELQPFAGLDALSAHTRNGAFDRRQLLDAVTANGAGVLPGWTQQTPARLESGLKGMQQLNAPDARQLAMTLAAFCRDAPKKTTIVCVDTPQTLALQRALTALNVPFRSSLPRHYKDTSNGSFAAALLRLLDGMDADYAAQLTVLRAAQCRYGQDGALAARMEYELRRAKKLTFKDEPDWLAFSSDLARLRTDWRNALSAAERSAVFAAALMALCGDDDVTQGALVPVPMGLSAAMFLPFWEQAAAERVVDDTAPEEGAAPLVTLCGLLEAQLDNAGRVILADCTAVNWPGYAAPPPFLALRQAEALGLPGALEQQGFTRAVFRQLAAADEVVLARRSGDTPSPFWRKLDTLLALHKQTLPVLHSVEAVAPTAADHTAAPCPPQALRPREYTVSDVETLRGNPFALYVRRVLCCEPLPDLAVEADQSMYGMLLHKVLEQFNALYPRAWPQDAAARLKQMSGAALKNYVLSPVRQHFWQQALNRTVDWLIETERTLRSDGRHVAEREYRMAAVFTGGITVRGRLDRVDKTAGGAVILDYKTGSVPTRKDLEAGRALQLYLEALLWHHQHGGEPALEYWELSGKSSGAGRIRPVPGAPLDAVSTYVNALLAAFDTDMQPYYFYPQGVKSEAFRHIARAAHAA
ncbi:MAG: PD-(D/E)XK nuclease family protein, partial [Holosporales bacterium]